MPPKSWKKVGYFYIPHQSTKRIEKGIKRGKEIVTTADDTGGGFAQPPVYKNKFDTKTLKVEVPKKPTRDVVFAAKKDDSSTLEDAKISAPATAKKTNDEDSFPAEEYGSDNDSIFAEEYGSDNDSMSAEKFGSDNNSISAEEHDSDDDTEEDDSDDDSTSAEEHHSESKDTSNKGEDAKNKSVAAAPTYVRGEDAKNKSVAAAPTYGGRIDRSVYTGPKPAIPPLDCIRKLAMCNLSPSIEERDVRNFFKDDGNIVEVEFTIEGLGYVKFETHDEARQAIKRHKEVLMGYPIELYDAEERSLWDCIIPNPKYKYLFMGNLSRSIKKSDVRNFFKDDGTVKLVRLMRDGRDYPGYGHVKFASFDEALKAVKRGGEKLCGREVELVLASKTSVWDEYTPSSRKPPRLGRFVSRFQGFGPIKRRDGFKFVV